ncbi:MAG: hypothetical protein ACOYK8_01705 [Alphaproteobacteria bacterium]
MDDISLRELALQAVGEKTLWELGQGFADSMGYMHRAVGSFLTDEIDGEGKQKKVTVPHEFHHLLVAYLTGDEPNGAVKTEIQIIMAHDVNDYAHRTLAGIKLRQSEVPPFTEYMSDFIETEQRRFFSPFSDVADAKFSERQRFSILAEKIQHIEEERSLENPRPLARLKNTHGEYWPHQLAKHYFNDGAGFNEAYPEAAGFIKDLWHDLTIEKEIYQIWQQQNPAPTIEELALTYVFYRHVNKAAEEYMAAHSMQFGAKRRFCELSNQERGAFPLVGMMPDLSRAALQTECKAMLAEIGQKAVPVIKTAPSSLSLSLPLSFQGALRAAP